MPRTPRVVDDRRQQILEAALQVFSQKGYQRATNKDIARAIGITPGLIYHYFESKEALLSAILQEVSPLRILQTLPDGFEEQPPSIFFPRLFSLIVGQIETPEFIQFIRVMLPEVIYAPELATFLTETIARFVEPLVRYLERWHPRSAHIQSFDARLALHLLISTIVGVEIRRHILRDATMVSYSREEIIAHLVAIALQGLELS